MIEQNPFKWRHLQAEIILLCVRWSLRYSLSYREPSGDDARARAVRRSHDDLPLGATRTHPNWKKHCRPYLKAWNDFWKVDETSITIKKVWTSLYRAVASQGKTLEFLLSPTRDAEAATRFFLKAAGALPEHVEWRQVKYLNTLIEQDHRFIKRLTTPRMGFFSFETARRTVQGCEIMNRMRKGQRQGVDKGDGKGQAALVARLFGGVA